MLLLLKLSFLFDNNGDRNTYTISNIITITITGIITQTTIIIIIITFTAQYRNPVAWLLVNYILITHANEWSMFGIVCLSIAICLSRRESQKYQAADTNSEGEEMQGTSQENQVSNAIGDMTDTAGAIAGVARRDAASATFETTDKTDKITTKFQDKKHDSNDSSDESENAFVVYSSERSIQSPLAMYNDFAASAAEQTTTYIPGVTSGDKNNSNNNEGNGTQSDNSNGKDKGLKENLLLSKSSKNGEAKEKANKAIVRQSSTPARSPSKIFLENNLQRLSITTANKTLNGYSVSGKEKQGEAGDGQDNEKQNEKKKQNEKNKTENGSSGKAAKSYNYNNNNSKKSFPKNNTSNKCIKSWKSR